MSLQPKSTGYKKADMEAAEQMIRLHLEKFKKHVDADEWPMACSALRAIEGECHHASRMSAALSFKADRQRSGAVN
jgi:hypothetical protein